MKVVRNRSRAGFTLVELLVVLVIVVIIAAVTLPVVVYAMGERRMDSAASAVQGEMTAALARAQAEGAAGVRLVPDPTRPIARLADGSIDPASPIAYNRLIPLATQPGYSAGRVAVRGLAGTVAGGPPTNFPPGFVPAPGRLVLEGEPLDADGLLAEPTSWAWNVRAGDRLEMNGKVYTVCGPVAVAPADGNPERFVGYDPAWPTLDRGDGPAEWLLLTNGRDDDGDGWVDNGFNGLDETGDGTPDDAAEWTEDEEWIGREMGMRQVVYTVRRRPAPAYNAAGVTLAGASIDGGRSRFEANPWTGEADLMFDGSGRVEPRTPAGRPVVSRWFHLWLTDRMDLAAAIEPGSAERLVSIDPRTGRAASSEVDPAARDAALREAEGGGP